MIQEEIKAVIKKINNGEVGVLPTDTIYGVVASVRRPESIERVYAVTERSGDKPFIVLVSNFAQLTELGITISAKQKAALDKLWPGPVSAILPVPSDKFSHIHRGRNTLAVRVPDLPWLRDLVEKTGPIIATSANQSGQPTPSSIADIKEQLPGLDFYVEGPVGSEPSRLVRVQADGSLEWIQRQS